MTWQKEQELNQITRSIVNRFNPYKVILFGSYAQDEEGLGSDYDLFVVQKTIRNRQIDEVRKIRRALSENRKTGVDLIVWSIDEYNSGLRQKNVFLRKILKEGKELYAAK